MRLPIVSCLCIALSCSLVSAQTTGHRSHPQQINSGITTDRLLNPFALRSALGCSQWLLIQLGRLPEYGIGVMLATLPFLLGHWSRFFVRGHRGATDILIESGC